MYTISAVTHRELIISTRFLLLSTIIHHFQELATLKIYLVCTLFQLWPIFKIISTRILPLSTIIHHLQELAILEIHLDWTRFQLWSIQQESIWYSEAKPDNISRKFYIAFRISNWKTHLIETFLLCNVTKLSSKPNSVKVWSKLV